MRNINGISPYSFPGILFQEISLDYIDQMVCNSFCVTQKDLQKRTRRMDIVEPRKVCMALRSIIAGQTLTQTGNHFCKDHATVLHARKSVLNRYQVDLRYREQIQHILNSMNVSIERFERYKN